jgi:geranylgeranyl diphosphate synthase type II
MNKSERRDNLTDNLTQYYGNAVKTLQFNSNHDEVYYALHYVFSMKGKKIRPILLLHANQLFDGTIEEALPAALAIELFHNFTLVHDDIMDEAPIRRGMPTVHVKYGMGTAINTGDLLMIVAYKYLTQISSEYLREAIRMFNAASTKIMEGQCLDLDFENREIVSSREYLQMIELKTSLLIALCMKLGALLAGASPDDQELMYRLGKNIGLCYQLKDDWLDVYGGAGTGKKIGGDIIQNKKTYLYIKAWELADNEGKEKMVELRTLKNGQEKIKETIQIYDLLDIGTHTKNVIDKYYLAAIEYLDALMVEEEKKQPMYDLINRIHLREF